MKKIIVTPLVLLTLTCIAQTDSALVRFVNPPSVFAPKGYSQAVVVDLGTCRMLITSGQVARDASGKLIGLFSFAKQANQIFNNIKSIVESQGGTMNDLVKLNVYIANLDQTERLREIRDKYINSNNPPATTVVQVSRDYNDGELLKVDATAIIPKARRL